MTTIDNLVSTSASDARITLDGILRSNPQLAAQLSLQLLERLRGAEGQTARRQAAARTLRAAAKRIAEDDTADPQGPSMADMNYTLPIADLRRLLTVPTADHAERVRDILASLLQIRGEVQCDTRRKTLLAALGKSTKALLEDEEEAA